MIRQERSQLRVGLSPRRRGLPRRVLVRRVVVAAVAAVIAVGGFVVFRADPTELPAARDVPGTPAWARAHYGDPDARGFEKRNIVPIDFLGRTMLVHRKARRHFLRLERLFEARAPEYAALVAIGTYDDWSYHNRTVRGVSEIKSNHAFGLAVDINALTNVLTTVGDMPAEVVLQWEVEGGDWGGDWTRPDPMHFETHLTPAEIKERYDKEGDPRPWYLEELVGGR